MSVVSRARRVGGYPVSLSGSGSRLNILGNSVSAFGSIAAAVGVLHPLSPAVGLVVLPCRSAGLRDFSVTAVIGAASVSGAGRVGGNPIAVSFSGIVSRTGGYSVNRERSIAASVVFVPGSPVGSSVGSPSSSSAESSGFLWLFFFTSVVASVSVSVSRASRVSGYPA